MKSIWYHYIMKPWMAIMLSIFYQKIKITGAENIPCDKPIIFLPNHQNAFMDGLLVNTRNKRTTHALIRASIFGNRISDFLLRSINLMPVYRIRDGISKLERNQKVFEDCYEILKKNDCLLIHPEGNHDIKKQVRNISKGFTRVALGAIEKYPNLPLVLIPVGINYSHTQLYFGKVSIHFSEPIKAHDYQDQAQELRSVVENELHRIVFHIDDDNYSIELEKLESTNTNFSNVIESYDRLNQIRSETNSPGRNVKKWINPVHYLVKLNNIILVLLWTAFESKIKDRAFDSSLKFCFGIVVLPLVYIFKYYLVQQYFGIESALFYLALSLLSLPLLSRRFRYFN